MTTLRDNITASIRQVITYLSETWQYRKRTSTGAAAATFGSYVDLVCHPTNKTSSEQWDDDRKSFIRRDRMRLRVRDDAAVLVQGDQVKDTAGGVWAVVGVLSSGPGTIAYDIAQESPVMQQAADRNGGV